MYHGQGEVGKQMSYADNEQWCPKCGHPNNKDGCEWCELQRQLQVARDALTAIAALKSSHRSDMPTWVRAVELAAAAIKELEPK